MYYPTNITQVTEFKEDGTGGHVARMAEMRNANALIVRPEETRLIGRSRHIWAENIKTDLKEIRCENVEWIQLARNRDKWWAFFDHGNEPSDYVEGWQFLD